MKINISKRFENLIERGNEIYTNSDTGYNFNFNSFEFADEQYSKGIAWKLSTKNILQKVYGERSEYYVLFSKIFSGYSESLKIQYCQENIAQSLGILTSAKEEFDLGLIQKIIHIVSVEFFDNVLDQAKELLRKGYKDPAAILGRIIIENTLKDLCKRNDIQLREGEGASSLNEKLKSNHVFTLPQFKLCRTNIELGNDAAHGNFMKYSEHDVSKMFEYIENSLLIL
jgi:hypothetical protein